MAPWDDNLTGVLHDIAAEPSTPLHVLAGPGTGKTFAMMRRVARLLEEQVDPSRILAISFTRTAATDLRSQLDALTVPGVNDVRASTLHSLCFSLLSQFAVFALTNRVPRPLLDFEVKYLEMDLGARHGGIRAVRKLLEAYEAAWARLQTDTPGGPSNEIDTAFHSDVVEWLIYHHAMLIGELIPLTLRFAEQNPASDLIPAFEHVLVDEYQDLNRAEQELIDRLARHGTLTVIGDDCQSIYSFRYANPEGIRSFATAHGGTVSKTIDQCRRCPPNIVAMSNALISHEPQRTRLVPLTSDATRPNADVVVVQHRTAADEVAALADFIVKYLDDRPSLPHGQVLVLAPRRFIGNALRDALIDRGLNSMSYFTEDPVQPPSAAEGFALLTLLVDPEDRAALRAWLGMGSASGRTGGYDRLIKEAQAQSLEPSEILRRIDAGSMSVPHTGALVARWRDLTKALGSLAGLTGLDLVRAIWPVENQDCDDIRLTAEAIAVHGGHAATVLEDLRQEITQPTLPDSDGDVIRVMSLHKSKGLTASAVVIAGAMAGAVPHVDYSLPAAERDAQLREQRRLFYVAITRAKDALVISAPLLLPFAQAMKAQVTVVRQAWVNGGKFSVVAMSPFLDELGPECPKAIQTQQWKAAASF